MTPYGVALEITPPRTPRPELLLARVHLLGAAPSAVHVISRPGRQSSLDASIELSRVGVAAVWHLCNRGRSSAEIDAEIDRAARAQIGAALVVRGESGEADRTDTPALRTLVARIRSALPRARVGVTLNPYLDAERTLANLWPKLEAGAAFVQTQPLFALSTLSGVAECIRQRAARVSIVPMVIPLFSLASAEKLSLRLRVPLPEPLLTALAEGGQAAGWSEFAETLRGLRGSGLADGVAVMTQELDPPAGFGARVSRALRESGWLPDGSAG